MRWDFVEAQKFLASYALARGAPGYIFCMAMSSLITAKLITVGVNIKESTTVPQSFVEHQCLVIERMATR